MLQTMFRVLPGVLNVIASAAIVWLAWDWIKVRPAIYRPDRLDAFPVNWPRVLTGAAFMLLGLLAVWL